MQKSAPWPTMRGSTANTGAHADLLGWNKSKDEYTKYTEIRRLTTQGPIFTTPTIGPDETIYCGSADKTLYAYNPLKDETAWSFKVGEAIDSATALHNDGTVHLAACDGKFYKLSEQGKELWHVDVIKDRHAPTLSSIFWWEGNVAIDDEGNTYAGNDDFYMYSFDAEGTIRWAYPTGMNIWSTPAIFEDLIIFCSFDFHVYALNRDTGELVWRTQVDNFAVSSPAISKEGNVYIGTLAGTFYGFDVRTGDQVWSTQHKEHIYASAAIDDEQGVLYIGDASGTFTAYSTVDHAKKWEVTLDGAIRASAAIGPDPTGTSPYRIYIGDGAGIVHAISPEGSVEWSVDVQRHDAEALCGITASVAAGNYGVAVATVEGDIVWVPYGYQPTETTEKEAYPTLCEHHVQPGDAGAWAGVHSFTFTNVVFDTPSIISSFDLIAIASVVYQWEIVVHANGDVTGKGHVMFGSKEGKDGVTISRTLKYIVKGTVAADGTFSLFAKHCLFELSAFPIAVDELRFSGVLTDAGITHPHVRVTRRKKGILTRLLAMVSLSNIRFISGYLVELLTSRVLYQAPMLVVRAGMVALRCLRPSVRRAWKLADERGDIVAVGTYVGERVSQTKK